MFNFVKSVTIRLNPAREGCGMLRDFLAMANSPRVTRKYAGLEVKQELLGVQDSRVGEVELVFENGTRQTVRGARTLNELRAELAEVMAQLESQQVETMAEHVEDNPYVAMAKQQSEKMEVKRKKLMAEERGKK